MTWLHCHAFLDKWVETQDQLIGKVKDLLFDDQTLTLRHIVVDSESFLSRREVFISPKFLDPHRTDSSSLFVNLASRRIENAPDHWLNPWPDRHFEKEYYQYYGMQPYWKNTQFWAAQYKLPRVVDSLGKEAGKSNPWGDKNEKSSLHLISFTELRKFCVEGPSVRLGSLKELIFECREWQAGYLVVAMPALWKRKFVWIPQKYYISSDWSAKEIQIRLDRSRLETAPYAREFYVLDENELQDVDRHYQDTHYLQIGAEG